MNDDRFNSEYHRSRFPLGRFIVAGVTNDATVEQIFRACGVGARLAHRNAFLRTLDEIRSLPTVVVRRG